LGWAEITHPYHPFRGQRFYVLKTRRISGVETLVLRHQARGTFAVPREWTDQANPSIYNLPGHPSPILHGQYLLELIELVKIIKQYLQKRG